MFAAIQRLLFGAKPCFLYEFTYGPFPDSVYRYTNTGDDVTVEGRTYRAVPIGHGNVKRSSTLDNTALEVTMALGNEMSALYGLGNPVAIVNLSIGRMHLSDPDRQVVPYWSGNVLDTKFTREQEFVMTCEPVTRSMRRLGLVFNYQPMCPYALYDPGTCRVPREAYTREAIVQEINGVNIVLSDGWKIEPHFYGGGEFEYSAGGFHGILEIKAAFGNRLRIGNRPIGLKVGDTVRVRPSCGRGAAACREFNNMPNFGGCPRGPTATPYADRSIWG